MGRIDLPPICKCTLSQQMMGNGCGICSPGATIAGLVQEVKALEAERDNLRDHIHTCGPTCMKAGCFNRRLRDAAQGALEVLSDETYVARYSQIRDAITQLRAALGEVK